ncbi:MAG: hypothetical protein K8R21_01890, partial [Leptospira sp.]|nr:hypothetical protein [Leptospira sp.]
IILQLGAAMNYTSVPSFSGSLNGDSIPFYYKNDGTVSALGQTNDPGSNAIVLAALASKSPNFYVASLVVYFSAICRFSI